MQFQLHLGPPRHGWLPVHAAVGGRVLQFHAWRGPTDPVRDLHQAIQTALAGGRGTVLWHLDPEGYFFELASVGGTFCLHVSHARQAFFSARESVAAVQGGAHEVLRPLVQALQQFEALRAGPPHWWQSELPQLERMARQVSDEPAVIGVREPAAALRRTGT